MAPGVEEDANECRYPPPAADRVRAGPVRTAAGRHYVDDIYYSTIALDGTQSAPRLLGLTEDNGSINYPDQLLVAADGTTHLLLGTRDDSDDPNSAAYLLIRADGTSTAADLGKNFGTAHGALDGKGRIHIVLTTAVLKANTGLPYPTYTSELRYAIYADGAFEKGRIYAKKDTAIGDINIAMGPDNKPTVMWEQYQGSGSVAVIARRPGSTTARTVFTSAGGYGLRMQTAPDGGAVVLWSREGTTGSLYASTYQ